MSRNGHFDSGDKTTPEESPERVPNTNCNIIGDINLNSLFGSKKLDMAEVLLPANLESAGANSTNQVSDTSANLMNLMFDNLQYNKDVSSKITKGGDINSVGVCESQDVNSNGNFVQYLASLLANGSSLPTVNSISQQNYGNFDALLNLNTVSGDMPFHTGVLQMNSNQNNLNQMTPINQLVHQCSIQSNSTPPDLQYSSIFNYIEKDANFGSNTALQQSHPQNHPQSHPQNAPQSHQNPPQSHPQSHTQSQQNMMLPNMLLQQVANSNTNNNINTNINNNINNSVYDDNFSFLPHKLESMVSFAHNLHSNSLNSYLPTGSSIYSSESAPNLAFNPPNPPPNPTANQNYIPSKCGILTTSSMTSNFSTSSCDEYQSSNQTFLPPDGDKYPNPRRLVENMREYDKCVMKINLLRNSPSYNTPEYKRERNRLASKTSRLKKKCEYQKNIISMHSLEKENRGLVRVLREASTFILNNHNNPQYRGIFCKTVGGMVEKFLPDQRVAGNIDNLIENILKEFSIGCSERFSVGRTSETNEVVVMDEDGMKNIYHDSEHGNAKEETSNDLQQ